MRVAIATFGADVSPRFCFARQVLVVALEGDGEPARATVSLADAGCYRERLERLRELGVEVLVCGGYPREFLPEAERAGIHVLAGVSGPFEAVLAALRAPRSTARPRLHANCWCRFARQSPSPARARRRPGTERARATQRSQGAAMSSRLVAVACESSSGLAGNVSGHFGHTPFFVVAQLGSDGVQSSSVVAAPEHGASGCSMPQFVQSLGVNAVILGGLGARAAAMLDALGVQVIGGASGNAGEALRAFAAGQLSAGDSSCSGHGEGGCGHHSH